MHELAIAEALLNQVREIAAGADAARVSAVHITIGALSGVDPEALRFAFPFAAADSCAADANLIIEAIPAHVHCNACGEDTTPDFPIYLCEQCGSGDVTMTAGRDLLLTAVEIAQDDAHPIETLNPVAATPTVAPRP